MVKLKNYVGEGQSLRIKIFCLTVERATLFLQIRPFVCLILVCFLMYHKLSKGVIKTIMYRKFLTTNTYRIDSLGFFVSFSKMLNVEKNYYIVLNYWVVVIREGPGIPMLTKSSVLGSHV